MRVLGHGIAVDGLVIVVGLGVLSGLQQDRAVAKLAGGDLLGLALLVDRVAVAVCALLIATALVVGVARGRLDLLHLWACATGATRCGPRATAGRVRRRLGHLLVRLVALLVRIIRVVRGVVRGVIVEADRALVVVFARGVLVDSLLLALGRLGGKASDGLALGCAAGAGCGRGRVRIRAAAAGAVRDGRGPSLGRAGVVVLAITLRLLRLALRLVGGRGAHLARRGREDALAVAQAYDAALEVGRDASAGA